jgi:vacuolar-type H+-ATPase subunit F/Vma7
MSEGMKVAIVGQAGLCFGFRALGLKVFSPETVDEARAVMAGLEKEDYALCFLHESYFGPLQEEREAIGKKFRPVIVGFSDYRKISDHLEVRLKEMAVRATGSDSLVKRKGKI